MDDPLDDRLSELVDWLLDVQIQQPASHPYLMPIKQKCKLRDCLTAAVRRGDRPVLRAPSRVRPSRVVAPSSRSAPSPSSSSAQRPAPRPTATATATASASASSSAVTDRTPLLSVQPSSSVVVPSSPVVRPARRHLMIDCAREAPGTVVFTWAQDNVAGFLGIPEGNFFGFCNAATGRFLQSPDDFEGYVKGIRGKATLARAQERYESVGHADAYVTREYNLTHLETVGPLNLTPQEVLSCVDKAKGPKMILYIVGSADGGGHAIGIIRTSTGFLFLDVNEGLTRLGDRNALWRFLFYYITDKDQGLDKTYPKFCMGVWS